MHARVSPILQQAAALCRTSWAQRTNHMNYQGHRVVADRWGWRTLAPWVVPMLLVPVLLILSVTVYVFYQDFF